MSTVRIPPVLRSHTGGEREIETSGGTVGDALADLVERYPSMKSQLFDNETLQRYVNVYLNNQDIQYMDKLQTPVQDNDTIIILPAMAGGVR